MTRCHQPRRGGDGGVASGFGLGSRLGWLIA